MRDQYGNVLTLTSEFYVPPGAQVTPYLANTGNDPSYVPQNGGGKVHAVAP